MTAGRRRSRRGGKLYGGNFYGFSAGSATGLGTAGAEYGAVDNSKFIDSATGQPRQLGGRRRRASKKSKKSRRKVSRRRRTMRGGGSVGNVGYGFTGTGSRGLADATVYQANAPPTSGPFAIPTGTR